MKIKSRPQRPRDSLFKGLSNTSSECTSTESQGLPVWDCPQCRSFWRGREPNNPRWNIRS